VIRIIISLVILLLFGAAKLPIEHELTRQHKAAFFHGAELTLDLREQVGQLGFLAALSGFRSLVADLLWIQAHIAWERTEWGKMALIFNNVTSLQPRALLFWDMAAWHMAWNASVAALEDPRIPRQALRVRAQRQYFKLGEDFLLRGIRNNPDRYLLYERLGILYRDKFRDHCAAAEAFSKAASFPGAPHYLERFVAYELSYCPGREREAYELLRELYQRGKEERLPTLLSRLKEMQEKLDVPADERIYTPPEG
jgi:hypothetical protein